MSREAGFPPRFNLMLEAGKQGLGKRKVMKLMEFYRLNNPFPAS